MKESTETVKQALALAEANPAKALEILDAGLDAARKAQDPQAIAMLARHAGAVCHGAQGDHARVLRYYLEALGCDPEDPWLHFACGDIRRSLGQREAARAAFIRSLDLAAQRQDADVTTMARAALAAMDAE